MTGMTAFWINFLFIILFCVVYMVIIQLAFLITGTKEDDDEDDEPPKIDYEKRCTEKDLFINAYTNMFNETVENAQHAYKTTDTQTRRIMINEYQRRCNKQ